MPSKSSAITLDGSQVIQRTLVNTNTLQLSPDCLQEYFEIPNTLKWIQEGGYKKIALQFPDELLHYSHYVSKCLGSESVSVYVLGDTSYGSCCVDQVAISHISDCDAVIHYGKSCQTRPSLSLPILFIYGVHSLPCISDLVQPLLQAYHQQACQYKAVIVLWDTHYEFAIQQQQQHLESLLASTFTLVILGHFKKSILVQPSSNVIQESLYDVPPGLDVSECVVFYIGSMDTYRCLNIHVTHTPQPVYCIHPDSLIVETPSRSKLLQKRYLAIQKARDAQVVGLVVGTLGVASYLSTIESLQSLLALHSKKSYLLSVGKLTPAKLGNFLEVDVFVLLACPESVMDMISNAHGDYLKPVVTVFEMVQALSREGWIPYAPGHHYVTDFSLLSDQLMASVNESMENLSINRDSDASDEEPEFSLATGSLIRHQKHHVTLSNDAGSSDQLVRHWTRGDTDIISVSAIDQIGAGYLKKRTYQGLDIHENASQSGGYVSVIEEGRGGIAKGYQQEGM